MAVDSVSPPKQDPPPAHVDAEDDNDEEDDGAPEGAAAGDGLPLPLSRVSSIVHLSFS
jgi:hypothetical protein